MDRYERNVEKDKALLESEGESIDPTDLQAWTDMLSLEIREGIPEWRLAEACRLYDRYPEITRNSCS